MSAEAERAALNELAAQHGMAGAQIFVDTVRTNPATFSQQQNALGDFARALLAGPPAASPLAIVPFVAAAAAPPPGRSTSSAIDLAPDMISKHENFTPLGPELYPEAPAEHAFSHLRE